MRDIFVVCNNFEELGGLQRWVHHVARLFTERGHHVHVIGVTHKSPTTTDATSRTT
jgi:hypothetical protein